MKMRADRMEGRNAIARHGTDGVAVAGVEYTESVIVPWAGDVIPWLAPTFDALTVGHFEQLAALSPELVLFGTGSRIRFAPPALLKPLFAARIGIETMDSAAACRTFNVLLAEGRSVVAALLYAGAPSVAPGSDAPEQRL